jgi:hypothetical protein
MAAGFDRLLVVNETLSLTRLAQKLVWWQPVELALANPLRLACQVMVLGTWEDAIQARAALGDELFRQALQHAPAGVFDARSWNYWHLVLGMTPVPPLPQRRLP